MEQWISEIKHAIFVYKKKHFGATGSPSPLPPTPFPIFPPTNLLSQPKMEGGEGEEGGSYSQAPKTLGLLGLLLHYYLVSLFFICVFVFYFPFLFIDGSNFYF